MKPLLNDPKDPVSQKDLDYINESRAQTSESYKDPKTITLMITKRGHKWFILGPYPAPEKDLRMINGQLVDRNELMRDPYPTRNE